MAPMSDEQDHDEHEDREVIEGDLASLPTVAGG
jgi:hypothetical protein